MGVVLVSGAASAGYAVLGHVRVSAAAVGLEIDALLSADATPGLRVLYPDPAARPLWFAPEAREAALATLADADRDGLPLDSALSDLRAMADTASTPGGLARLDLDLSQALLRLGDALGRPQVDAASLYGHQWTPAPPRPSDPAARLAASLAGGAASAAALDAWAAGLRPSHPGYLRLRAVLAHELDLAELPPLTRDLARGDSGAAVVALHQRLAAEEHDLAADNRFGHTTVTALQAVQRQRGLSPSGRLDRPTRDALNRRRTELIPLLRLNLEKWRWLPRDLGALHVWVNIPRYELVLRERAGDAWAEAIRFRAVVGAADWQTPVFSDTMETVVFNPTWTVPPSIQRESYGRVRGRVVRPPGPGNAMGRVKFLFPNAHSVYVHDTPTKWAFGVDDRARSHGCVRAGDPEGLARELLRRTNGWTAERVAAIFRGPWRGPDPVRVEGVVPVHLVYFTAEVDADGRLQVWNDVYDRDPRLAKALKLELPDLPSDLLATLIADRIGDEAAVRADQHEADDAPRDPAAAPDTVPEPPPAERAAPAAKPVDPASDTTLQIDDDAEVL